MADFFSEATSHFLKPINSYLEDEDVSEVMVNGPDQIFVEKSGALKRVPETFKDEDELMAAIRRIAQMVGRKIDGLNPIMDARLEDGSRVHAVIAPGARKGPYLTIRKFQKETLGLSDLVASESLSKEMAKFLNLCVLLKKNIIVSGGTSSGKTTLLNLVSSLIPKEDRIIVIEDSSELQLQKDHVVMMEAKPENADGNGAISIRDLVKASLRMRPDRIVIGEIRGEEAMDLLQAMNTGHSGSMTTLHANTPLGALNRIETMAMMSDVSIPFQALRSQVSAAIDIVIQAQRMRDGKRKIVKISEVVGMDQEHNYKVEDIFIFDASAPNKKPRHRPTGRIPTFFKEAKEEGYKIDASLFESK